MSSAPEPGPAVSGFPGIHRVPAERDDVPPTSHALPLTNVFRDDVVTPSLTPEQVLAAAPAAEDGRFRVPRILDQEA